MPETFEISAFFQCMIPSLATLLVGITLVLLTAGRKIARQDVRIFSISCIIVSLGILPRIIQAILTVHGIAVEIPFIFTAQALFVVPLTGHLLHAARIKSGVPFPIIVIYGATACFVALSLFAGKTIAPAAGWIALGTAFVALISGLFSQKTSGSVHGASPGGAITMCGSVILLAVVVMDAFFEPAHTPLSFAFIPLLIISVGLFWYAGNASDNRSERDRLISFLIIALGLMPIFSGFVFVISSASNFLQIEGSPWKPGFLGADFFSLMVCTGLALISNRKSGGRTDGTLVAVMAMLCAIVNLQDILTVIIHEEFSLIIIMNDIFLALFIGASVHLASMASGKISRREISFFYGISILFMGFMLAKAVFYDWNATNVAVPARSVEHFVFIAVGVSALIRSMLILRGPVGTDSNPMTRRKAALMVTGYALVCIVLISSSVMVLFIPHSSMNFLIFIPMIIIAGGVFYQDIVRINAYMKRQILSSILRSMLIGIYCISIALIYLLLREHRIDFLVSRVIPYGMPPLLSFISAAFLSLFVLGLEKNRTETLPFSLICFCYAVLNLDILLVGIVPDIARALIISRIDHFFLVLIMLGANLHLVFLLTGKKNRWWIVYLGYLIGIVMAPMTLTDWYFNGMFTYYWGFFAKKAVLYDVMSILWLSALIYTIILLFHKIKREDTTRKRTLKNVWIAFILIASLSMTNTPAIYGFEIYPLGTFIFIPLFFLAYSLFKFNLDMAMQYVRTILFWSGLIVLLVGIGLAPMMVFHDKRVALTGGILMIAVLYVPLRSGWNAVLNLFIRKNADVLKDRYREFSASLSHIHHLHELHTMMRSWNLSVLDALSCTSVFYSKESDSFMGWTTQNNRMCTGLFGKPGNLTSEDVSFILEKDEDLIDLCWGHLGLLTRDKLFKRDGRKLFQGEGFQALKDVEIILPVFAHNRLEAVFFIGGKADGSRYTAHEMEILTNIGLFLGPHVENAKLLETLEREVEERTKDLNKALSEAMVKEKQIIERNKVIEQQNRISEVLLETSSRIHLIKDLDELFSFTLAQLRSLFPDLCGGIILEGEGRGLLEASAFVGLSEAEQKIILDNIGSLDQPDIDTVLNLRFEQDATEGHEIPMAGWKVFPLMGREDKAAGYMILNGQDLDGPSGETITLFIAQISAVVQNRLLLIHLEKMASTDGLTGVYNRSFLDRELDKAIRHSRRFKNMCFSIMVIDINGLKQINDTYGHSAGDMAIIKVAELLKSTCRETDIVTRIGGDELTVLMPSTNRVQAEILLDRLREGEKDLHIVLKTATGFHVTVPIRISIGLASSDEDDPDLVIKVADDLMYADKQRFYAEQAEAANLVRQ